MEKAEHMQNSHVGSIVCFKCQKRFITLNELHKHKSRDHPINFFHPIKENDLEQSLTCSSCDKSFTQDMSLINHAKECIVESFTCECLDVPLVLPGEADKKPLEYEWKKLHMRIVHIEQYTCFFCFHIFETNEDLNSPVIAKHEPKKKKIPKSKQTTKVQLKYGIDWENGNKINCPHCKKFSKEIQIKYPKTITN